MLTKQELQDLSKLISEIEHGTSGEIRLTLVKRRHFFERKNSIFDLAVKEFQRLKMHQTENRTGVLIFVLEKDREFQILGDEGIAKKISKEEWSRMASVLAEHFKNQNYFNGLKAVLRDVGERLKKDFPSEIRNENELSNDIVLR